MRLMLIPGNGGADVKSEIWYPWLVNEIKRLGLPVMAENMPDPELARASYWLPFIERKLDGNEESIVIGHSSGAIAALRYAETHRLRGMILVSAYHTDLGLETEKISGYFANDWQWGKIKENTDWIVQFHSLNDPHIAKEEARLVAEKLGSEYYELSKRGHFSETAFPEALKALRQKLRRETPPRSSRQHPA